ncbi:DUF1156 domain-containing protein [Faecalibaculum rodentium]|uniref:DUF1156 domain-containing protein n=7 Tax=Faecalibaculum rodentium TaxID=1702221 RepID=UPI0024907A07|nr:DUF1156 domain-containing protein [Faecalibaculum rodentium]
MALPLDKINEANVRDKNIHFGHPSNLHLWWARRPLASARAVIWASLVDDPSAHPELFPTEVEQAKERERLFRILEQLVVWENSNNEQVLEEAKAEIKKSMGDDIPELLDPFAGGGAIPLEGERLGLKSHAYDLNPVAVMINKAMIEIPPRYQGLPPVNPDSRDTKNMGEWDRSQGLAEDVKHYGQWMKEEAFKRIGHLYPKVKLDNGEEATPIAWIWARTVKCPNPACGAEVPLMKTLDLSTKKGKEVYVELEYHGGKPEFHVISGKSDSAGTVNRKGATCPHCGQAIDFGYIRDKSRNEEITSSMVAVVAEGKKGRLYLNPDSYQINTATLEKPEDYPRGELAYYPGHLNTKIYGLDEFHKLFTNRQLTALTTFSDLVQEAQKKAEQDAITAGLPDDGIGLSEGGTGAKAYGEAVAVYLAFLVDKLADYHSNLCSWHSSMQSIRNVFGRQAIPMVWDYAEANPFRNSAGSLENMLNWLFKAIEKLPKEDRVGEASQFNAEEDCGLRNVMVSTDPPYYDNIGYADLSDFFYVWMRRSLKKIYPDLFRTMLVPKAEELIATPYRHHNSKEEAKVFFEEGMSRTCEQIFKYAREDVPVTIYYAYKQSDADVNGTASSGWETMLNAIIHAGFSITGTWPMRTEMSNRQVASGTNALASSIVLVCRKRQEEAPEIQRRQFMMELRRTMRNALPKLQESNIAPVDMAQSAIGPGMAVFSKYKGILESDGTKMSVRTALQLINKEIDAFFNEQGEDYDAVTRFCVDLYSQYGFNDVKFGEADTLARAKNTSVGYVESQGDVDSAKGIVHLVDRKDLTKEVDPSGNLWRFAQQLTRAMADEGIEGAATLYNKALPALQDKVRDLVYRLFSIADQKGWNNEAFAYNTLIQSWPDIVDRAARMKTAVAAEKLFDDALMAK